ncbi:hypothetical protein [Mycobacteroides abscessus]|uniref:hypothetical protein n=1 Tax=Mycobacteroides abscessus TaxID=36809 RepID=UPI00092A209A|nr:hypothetical protein [Mycobacteroides abscessus]SIF25262.1 Uncharacterised protein [Mycobacteroides abscessus subsp. abscessus]SIF38620.1 Uncharacterised protein [Mycobacteroides abscessus subsp. abscessus]SIF83848.1 Uncharacterised protein [Mycobacteroides abscessus subsp. abscessus]
MTDPSKCELFTAEVVQAEQIPVDRGLTAEESKLFTDLERRLRAAWLSDPSDELRGLLRRMKAIRRARKKPAVPAEQPPAAVKPVERGPRQLHRELAEMAAKPRLKQKDVARLEQILTEAGSLVAHDTEYQRLYQWALRLHKGAPKPTVASLRTGGKRVGPAGLVKNPALTSAGREVLGGLPSSRRGH